jgi:hypothetical protein
MAPPRAIPLSSPRPAILLHGVPACTACPTACRCHQRPVARAPPPCPARLEPIPPWVCRPRPTIPRSTPSLSPAISPIPNPNPKIDDGDPSTSNPKTPSARTLQTLSFRARSVVFTAASRDIGYFVSPWRRRLRPLPVTIVLSRPPDQH